MALSTFGQGPRFLLSHVFTLSTIAVCVACGGGNSDNTHATSPTGGGDSGGTSSSSSGGSGGGPIGMLGHPTVGTCDHLAASGVWENIAPTQAESGQALGVVNAQGLALDPFNVGTVWMGASSVYPTSAGGLYKSTDCGASWTHMNTGMNGDLIDKAAIWSMAIDPVTEGTVYVVGAYGPGNLWKSTNGGVDFTALLPDDGPFSKAVGSNFVASVTMDPDDHLHLVIAPHGNCMAPYDPICNAESKDGGATWRMVKVPGDGWGEATGPYLLNATSWLSTLDGLWLTTDNGATWKDVKPADVHYVTGGEYTNKPLRKSALGNYYLPTQQDNGLITSTDGMTWTHINNSPNGSYEIAFAMGGGKLYEGDADAHGYMVADETAPDMWTALPTPTDAQYMGQGWGPYALEYDEDHHILYSTNFQGGFWRMVTP